MTQRSWLLARTLKAISDGLDDETIEPDVAEALLESVFDRLELHGRLPPARGALRRARVLQIEEFQAIPAPRLVAPEVETQQPGSRTNRDAAKAMIRSRNPTP